MPPKPTDRIFLRLGKGWAIGYDPLQWIVYSRRKRREEWYWNPVGYVSTSRDLLVRVLRENHAQLDDSAWRAVEELPQSFRDWYTAHAIESVRSRHHVVR